MRSRLAGTTVSASFSIFYFLFVIFHLVQERRCRRMEIAQSPSDEKLKMENDKWKMENGNGFISRSPRVVSRRRSSLHSFTAA